LIVKIYFENQKTDKVELKLYLESSNLNLIVDNRRSYKLVNDFQEFYEKVSPFIDLKTIYHTEFCSLCPKQDCYFGEEFCFYKYIKDESASGKDILDQ
jgi:hypothetical protein